MANLTHTAKVTKVTFIVLIAAVLGIIALKILFDIGTAIYNRLYPKSPPAPSIDFGKLPALDFSSVPTVSTSQDLTFKLVLVQEGLPDFGDRVRVFPIGEPKISFLTLDRFKERVKRFGFRQDPEALSPTTYKWIDPEIEGREIIVDISTGNFTLTYNFFADQQILQNRGRIDLKGAARTANKILGTLATTQLDSLDRDNATTALFKIEGGRLAQAVSISEANFVRVNILRKDIEQVPFVAPYSDRAPVSFLLTSLPGNKQIAEAQLIFWDVDFSKSGIYPIKSTADAFNQLKQGKGFITARFSEATEIIIQKIYLAYIELPEEYQQFLQPVYVFEGQHGFRAMIPAIRESFILSESTSE